MKGIFFLAVAVVLFVAGSAVAEDISKSESDIARRDAILFSMFDSDSNKIPLGSKAELNTCTGYKMPETEASQIDVSKEITKLRNEEYIKGISYTPNSKQ